MSETTREFSDAIKAMGDKIVNMTLKEAKELSDYLKEVHGIEPASGGAVMMAAPAGGGDGAEKPAEKTEFDVILESFDAAKKLNVIKVIRAATGAGLPESKALVESAGPACKIKTGISKEDAEKLKKDLENEGAKVSLK